MSEIDYEELIRSPLDDVESTGTSSWSLAIIGAGLGAVLGVLMTIGLGDTGEPVAASEPTTSPTVAVQPAASPDYPDGYFEISDGLAARSDEVILGDDVVTVAFTTAVRRGDDPAEASWPVGGTWLLESASGLVVESSRVVVGRFSPGAFTVQFPAELFNGETEFESARVVARWDTDIFTGSLEIPFDGEPFTAPEELSIPVNQQVTLIVPELRLGRFLGSVAWETVGADLGTTAHLGATLLDENEAAIGSYERFAEILEPSNQGVIEIFWSEPFPTSQEGAVTASLEYSVGVVVESPVSVAFDLTDVPVGR